MDRALSAAIADAQAKGQRPFRCWSCQEWFTDTGHSTYRRPRVVCTSPKCHEARRRYMSDGLLPGEAPVPSPDQQEHAVLTRAILRALEAEWLTDIEIAEEFGCTKQLVGRLRRASGRRPVGHKRRRTA